MRALVLDDQRHAWAKHPLRFVVHDPDEAVLFSTDAETSHFGIASADWTIPSSQKLGSYRVSADITETPTAGSCKETNSSAFPATNCPLSR